MKLFLIEIHSSKTQAQSIGLVMLFILMQLTLLSGVGHAQSCNTTGVLLEWNFNSTTVQCNGAVGYPSDLTTPWLKAGKRWYCPNINAGCGKGLLGSKGHANTDQFEQAICLLGFQNNAEALKRGGCFFDGNSTIFNPDQCNNLIVEYIIPAGKTACLSDFSLNIIQKQVSTSPNFETQGVGVKRNGVLIYSQTQTITASHINNPANPMVFSFTGNQFCTDGNAEVKFEIVFGLVHKLVEAPKATGYDNIILNGSCGGPSASAIAQIATCGPSGPLSNGQIVLSGFQATDHYDYTVGNTYTGLATYASATTIPVNGVIVNNLADPGTPKSYTVRVFSSSGCHIDKTVTLNPALCPPPTCTKPSSYTITPTDATCGTTTVNNDAKISVSGITNGNRVGISLGNTYNGPSYSAASNLAAGAFTFLGLTNPNGSQTYTIRIFNGSDGCFIDETQTITEISCGPCKKSTIEICVSGAFDPDSKPGNGISTEDDITTYDLCKDTKFIDLELTKTVTPASGTTCPTNTNFTWTLSLSNKGTMTAKDIQVSDLVPDDLVVVSTSATKGHFGALSGWLLDSLQANETVTATLVTKALKAGIYTNCAEINSAFPLNDIDSTPGNNSTTEDDDDCATITVTGSDPPIVEKGFSPMLTKPNVATRMTIKIFNNSPVPIKLTAPFIDNLPSSPGQMKIAAAPNLVSVISGVTAIANDTKITIPVGSTLLPGLNQIQVDITMPLAGTYCNIIAAGSLITSQCDNVLPDTACVEANSTFVIAPIISKSFSPTAVNTNANSILTLVVENRNAVSMTLLSDFNDRLPAGLVVAGTATSTCGTVTAVTGSGIITLPSGTVLAAGTCTISIPVKSTTSGVYCNFIPMNAMIVDIGGQMTGNEDLAEACLTVTQTPCTVVDLTSVTANPTGIIDINGTVNLTANSIGSGGSTLYYWSAPSGSFSNTGSNPTVWTAPATANTYVIKVVADNGATGYGVCKDSITLDIVVQAVCTKPDAGTDQAPACVGSAAITTATLAATAVSGGAWTQVVGNPAGAVVTTPASATSGVTGLNPGVYQFIWATSPTCSDTVKITIPNCACVTPDAGTDQTPVCVGNTPITTATLAATAVSGGAWTQAPSNPAGAVITTPSSATSGITGLTPGVFDFIWSVSPTCSDTIRITVPNCSSTPCSAPDCLSITVKKQ